MEDDGTLLTLFPNHYKKKDKENYIKNDLIRVQHSLFSSFSSKLNAARIFNILIQAKFKRFQIYINFLTSFIIFCGLCFSIYLYQFLVFSHIQDQVISSINAKNTQERATILNVLQEVNHYGQFLTNIFTNCNVSINEENLNFLSRFLIKTSSTSSVPIMSWGLKIPNGIMHSIETTSPHNLKVYFRLSKIDSFNTINYYQWDTDQNGMNSSFPDNGDLLNNFGQTFYDRFFLFNKTIWTTAYEYSGYDSRHLAISLISPSYQDEQLQNIINLILKTSVIKSYVKTIDPTNETRVAITMENDDIIAISGDVNPFDEYNGTITTKNLKQINDPVWLCYFEDSRCMKNNSFTLNCPTKSQIKSFFATHQTFEPLSGYQWNYISLRPLNSTIEETRKAFRDSIVTSLVMIFVIVLLIFIYTFFFYPNKKVMDSKLLQEPLPINENSFQFGGVPLAILSLHKLEELYYFDIKIKSALKASINELERHDFFYYSPPYLDFQEVSDPCVRDKLSRLFKKPPLVYTSNFQSQIPFTHPNRLNPTQMSEDEMLEYIISTLNTYNSISHLFDSSELSNAIKNIIEVSNGKIGHGFMSLLVDQINLIQLFFEWRLNSLLISPEMNLAIYISAIAWQITISSQKENNKLILRYFLVNDNEFNQILRNLLIQLFKVKNENEVNFIDRWNTFTSFVMVLSEDIIISQHYNVISRFMVMAKNLNFNQTLNFYESIVLSRLVLNLSQVSFLFHPPETIRALNQIKHSDYENRKKEVLNISAEINNYLIKPCLEVLKKIDNTNYFYELCF